ncbi:metal ABC transporter solute-binding protein, Zn/Mn family [Sediminicoccus rosea]|jgi:zinc/manganese transport system substrate-binding protein|uniref:Zinc ABC transporter substrate-binding protein n=1 Tax=Sediminicoccus rosea TaxID=1225128 RepID=A0ABZ0PN30_9PROT|nr:zinc ABC transporter substrate-binding protein [Sediminicoccus rosea]WPB86772.1 zinc ABC transporter substrate-binding protein [Sediminicoccus rosea]
MHRRALLAAPGLLLARPAAAQPRPVAVASFSILGDLLRDVAGERMELRVIAGPDVDAHHFQPRPSHAEAVRGARLVLRNGAGFDNWFNRLIASTGFSGVNVLATEGLTLRRAAPTPGHNHGSQDPHAWQDARLAIGYLRNIEAGLVRADAAGAAEYRGRAAAATARLEALDAWVRAEIARVPEARRVVITSHDAFAYFGAAYGVRFLAPQGVGLQSEPSAQQVANLIRQIRAQNITAVFMENMANPATLRRLAEEAGVTVRGRLYADALSAPDGPAATYEAMMRHNVTLMVAAMQG